MDFEISAAGATIMAAIAAVIGSITTGWLERWHQKRAITAALFAEVAALSIMIRTRRYREDLEKAAEEVKSGEAISLAVPVPAHYCRIYTANLGSIGLLNPKQASELVHSYQLVDSVVQDVTPGGILASGSSDPTDFLDARDLLDRALSIGDSLATRSR
ncbi:hypothetical protein ACQKEK_11420 [Pseudomonas sp. NPDC077408]